MKQFLTFICLLFFLTVATDPGYAQRPAKLVGQARVDSFLNKLQLAKEDTNKVKLLNDLAYAYTAVDPAKGVKYAQQALDLAESLQYKVGIASAYGKLGVNNLNLSDYPKALEYLLTALKIYEELHDKRAMAGTQGNIGNIYIHQGNYDKALEYYFKVLKMFEELHSMGDIAITEANIANVYTDQNNFTKALEYNYKALKICTDSGYKRGIASNVKNIASIYESQRNYAQSLENDFTALKMFQEIDDRHSMPICIADIGECYLAMARDTIKIDPDKRIPASKSAKLDSAIRYLKKGVDLFTDMGDLDDLQQYSQYLSDAQVLKGNYKDALENYKLYVAINDSVFGNENRIKILNLQTKRDIDLKNKQIEIDKLAVAKKKNERAFYIIGIGLLLLVIVFIMRNYNSQKRSNVQLTEEKKRSEDLLLNILPSEVAEELKHKGTASAKHYDHVTVMFTDFVNFTQAGERMSPEALIQELHTCFKEFDEIISRHNIEKIKTIGDAYLAVSGLPVADQNHAENIVRAAIDINVFMRNRLQQLGDKTFEVRIGIHSGSVVAGIVGVKKFAYDIWGDTVNTAARIEENSAPGKINISQVTYELVKDKFTCTYRGNIVAKNKGELSMYFIES